MKNSRVATLVVVVGVAWWGCSGQNTAPATAPAPKKGGRLVATFRSEPRTYNRFVSPRAAEDLFMRLTQATLLRVNRVSGELEPWLATSWTSSSADGRVWTLKLRPGVLFSDGAPFSAADVQFTFQALYDKQVASPLASSLLIADQPLDVRAIDDTTIVLTMPAPYGPGLSLLDAIPILPRHKLEAAFKAGTFRDAWGLSTPPADLAGLGPFVLKSYAPGERMIFARNPHYWRQDEKGAALPRLDELELQIVPEQNAELLRLEGGTADLMTAQVRPEDLAGLRRLEASGAVQLVQAGVSINPDALWFNLTPGGRLGQRSSVAAERGIAARDLLRRRSTGLRGHRLSWRREPIYGPITPGNREWFTPDLPKTEHDVARAKALLGSIGLTDRNGDGTLEDKAGHPARFSILTQKGHTILEQLRGGAARAARQGRARCRYRAARTAGDARAIPQRASTTRCTSTSWPTRSTRRATSTSG